MSTLSLRHALLGQGMTLTIPVFLREWTGSFEAALLMAQLIASEAQGTDAEGWFMVTAEQLKRVCRLSESNYRTALGKLEELQLVERQRRGAEGTRWRIAPDWEARAVQYLEGPEWTNVEQEIADAVSSGQSDPTSINGNPTIGGPALTGIPLMGIPQLQGANKGENDSFHLTRINRLNIGGVTHRGDSLGQTKTIGVTLDTPVELPAVREDVPPDYRPDTVEELTVLRATKQIEGHVDIYPPGYTYQGVTYSYKGRLQKILARVAEGDRLEREKGRVVVYQTCLAGLEQVQLDKGGRHMTTPSLPVLPRSWLQLKMDQCRHRRWELRSLINALLEPKNLRDHCEVNLKALQDQQARAAQRAEPQKEVAHAEFAAGEIARLNAERRRERLARLSA